MEDDIGPLKRLLNNLDIDKESVPLNEVIGLLRQGSSLGFSDVIDEDKHNRDGEKQKQGIKDELGKKFEKIDDALDVIVKGNQEKFNDSIKAFIRVDANITDSQERLDRLRTSVLRCKQQLQIRKDMIAQLWKSHIEHVEMLRLLELVEEVAKVPEQVKVFTSEKQYLIAAKLLSDTRHHLDSDLVDFLALSELRVKLEILSRNLYDSMFEELLGQLFLKNELDDNSEQSEEQNANTVERAKDITSRLLETLAKQSLRTPRVERLVSAMIEPYTTSEKFIGLLIESLSMLGFLKETFQSLNQRIGKELSNVTCSVETFVSKKSPNKITATSMINANAKPTKKKAVARRKSVGSNKSKLLSLLQELFEYYKKILQQHSFVLKVIESGRVLRDEEDSMGFSMNAIWQAIQTELENVLKDYFSSADDEVRVSGTRTELDPLTLYKQFSDKGKTQPLFRFGGSTFSGNISDKSEASGNNNKTLVCPGHPRNFPICFQVVTSFVTEIESGFFKRDTSGSTRLNTFLLSFGSKSFLKYIRDDVNRRLDRACKATDAFKVTEQDAHFGLGLVKSIVIVENIIQELLKLCQKIPNYSGEICDIIDHTISQYLQICTNLHAAIMMRRDDLNDQDLDRHYLVSYEWLCAPAVLKFLENSPIWTALQKHKSNPNGGGLQNKIFEFDSKEQAAIKSVQMKQRLAEEKFLSGALWDQKRIIQNVESFSTLVNLCQSLEWINSKFQFGDKAGDSFSILSKEKQIFFANKFRSIKALSEKCLMSLKLELRSQCYFYLFNALRESNYYLDEDPAQADANILKLNGILCAFEETASSSMTPINTKYIFSEIGTLVSEILIDHINFIERVNSNGVVQMCRNIYALKQNLSNLSVSGSSISDLDRCLHYYELLNRPMQDIVNERFKDGKAYFSDPECVKLLMVMATRSEANAKNLQTQIARLDKA